jgi:hypothetical protein
MVLLYSWSQRVYVHVRVPTFTPYFDGGTAETGLSNLDYMYLYER